MEKSRRYRLLEITMIALFAALSYVVLVVLFIPFANMYIHFGNLVVVLAALLIGGWQGGLSGAVGMGLFDLLNGHADSAPKTFILKFLIGLTVGLVFHFFSTRKKFPSGALLFSGIVSVTISGAVFAYMIIVNHAFGGKSAILAPVFFGVGLLCIAFSLLKYRFSQHRAAAIMGAVCGMSVNIAGETLWKFVTYLLAGSAPGAAFTTALLGQASTLINAGIAVIGGTALFVLLEKPVKKIMNKV